MNVGDQLTPFVRRTDFDNWNRFAAVNDEFVSTHMDDEAGRAAGYSSAFGMGNLQWSYLHDALRQWVGTEGRIERVACQFRAPNLKGQTVTVRGQVVRTQPAGDRVQVDIELWTEDDEGNQLAPGTATVSMPAT